MADILNVQLGPCDVWFNGINLGHTKGGVELTYEPEYHDITVDKYGNTVAEKRLLGEKLMAKLALSEGTIDNLNIAMPLSTVAGATDGRIEIGKNAGVKLSAAAAQLILHPLDQTNNDYDVVIHKAVVANAVTIPYKTDEERLIEVEFHALIDESKGNGNYLGLIGDTTD